MISKSYREWIRSPLSTHAQLEIVGEASTGQDAIQLAELLSSDLVWPDLGLPDINGIGDGKGNNPASVPWRRFLSLWLCAPRDCCAWTEPRKHRPSFQGARRMRSSAGHRSRASGRELRKRYAKNWREPHLGFA